MLSDHDVREIRQLYDRFKAEKAAGVTPTLPPTEIAKLFGTTYKTIWRIGCRLDRDRVPDVGTVPDDARKPATPTSNTIAQRKVRARKPPASKRYPAHRDAQGRFLPDP